jgi:hypothetical protein
LGAYIEQMTVVYYTYRSFEEFENGRSYIGYRKCPDGETPETDKYLGSFSDKTFKPTTKEILGVYFSREDAMKAEIKLHVVYDVAKNPRFANRARATTTRFCLGGHSHESRKKISEAKKGKNLGARNPMFKKKHSKETRLKISDKIKGENNPNYGKNLSEEVKRKLSETRKGENNPFYGKKHSKETRKRFSEMRKRESLSEETRKKLSESSRGIKNPNYGKKHSKETREKISKAVKGKNSKLVNWSHSIYGVVLETSATELARKFPEQKLCPSTLSGVSNGKNSHHKGWKVVNGVANFSPPLRWIWVNPEIGILVGYSISELKNEFKHLNLDPSSLSKLHLKKQKSHKGWKCLGEYIP